MTMANRRQLRAIVSKSVRDGVPTDEILAHLRHEGASKIDSIRALCDEAGLPLAEAKRTVHFSPVWSDRNEQDEKFWDDLEAVSPDDVT